MTETTRSDAPHDVPNADHDNPHPLDDPPCPPTTGDDATSHVSLRFLLTPRWILFHVVVIIGIVGMFNLGLWQLDRLADRRAHNAAVESRYSAPTEPVERLLPTGGPSSPDDPSLAELEWRTISASGTYTGEQVRIVNRSQDGSAGWQAVSALRLEDGRLLLINRGFVPLDLDDIDAPNGTVELVGHLRPTQQRTFGGLGDPATGALSDAQRIDIARLAPQYDADLVPMYVELTESTPSFRTEGLPAPVRPPAVDEGNHLSYAVQWFCFSTAVAIGWVLAVRHSLRSRRQSNRPDPARAPSR